MSINISLPSLQRNLKKRNFDPDMRSFTALENAMYQFDDAAQVLKLDTDQIAMIKTPHRIIQVRVPVRMDDGSIRVFNGYRVQHNIARGPAKGGVRFHPDIDIDEMKALAFWMSIKCAVVNIPMGGGKGGVAVDPRSLSYGELERLSRRYILEMIDIFGPDRDIPAPDVGTDAQIMAWFFDTYSQYKGDYLPAMVTGKPIGIGGSHGRVEATAQGMVYCLDEAAQKFGYTLEKATVAIQGFGNAGSNSAKLLNQRGVKIIAISDVTGAYYNENGLDIPGALAYVKANKGLLEGIEKTIACEKMASADELLYLPVDILIPAALENQITSRNADKVQAKIIAECANGPTSYRGNRILDEKGVFIIPDILCNAGGVTVSYFEWVQNRLGYTWPRDYIQQELKRYMTEAFHECFDAMNKYQVPMRTAAYVVAIDRVATASVLRGLT